jgi:YfiH family protein
VSSFPEPTRKSDTSSDSPFALWETGAHGCRMVFAGRGSGPDRASALAAIAPEAPSVAWVRQIHSRDVIEARTPGEMGEGDALVCKASGVALSIVTADCVPILVASPRGLAAIHAGWRGIVQGIVGVTLERLDDVADSVAWIGPAIGSCCYEVDQDVADQVVASSSEAVARQVSGRKPHLDLAAAVRHQLRAGGLTSIHTLELCTRCLGDRLHSYRREGPGAGRNHAFIWKA